MSNDMNTPASRVFADLFHERIEADLAMATVHGREFCEEHQPEWVMREYDKLMEEARIAAAVARTYLRPIPQGATT